MKYVVDGWNNFCRVFELPENYHEGFCFGGGKPVNFLFVEGSQDSKTRMVLRFIRGISLGLGGKNIQNNLEKKLQLNMHQAKLHLTTEPFFGAMGMTIILLGKPVFLVKLSETSTNTNIYWRHQMTLYEEIKNNITISDYVHDYIKFDEARDGVKIVFNKKFIVRIFFENQFKWMQENGISSKVIGKTMYLWRRRV